MRFFLISNTSIIESYLPAPLDLDPNKNYEIGLLSFCTYNIIFNINSTNNKFEVSFDNKTFKEKTLEPGAYEIKTIANELINYYIELNANLATGKTEMEIYQPSSQTPTQAKIEQTKEQTKENIFHPKIVKIKFDSGSFMHKILGYKPNVIYTLEISTPNIEKGTKNTNKIISENRIDILDIQMINITCNLVSNNYFQPAEQEQEASTSNFLYSFPVMKVRFGGKLNEQPFQAIYSTMNTNYVKHLKFTVVDENKNLISFNNEKISLLVHIREQRNV